MAASESDIAAQLIERLLADPSFRAEFRRDPASACRAAGLDSLADEMSLGAGKAMMTLDVRESKSSLAGVMMAAAMEGIGVYQFGEHVLPHLSDVPGAVSDVLSRVNLPSIPLPEHGALAGAPSAPPVEPNGAGAEAAAGAGGGGAAAAATPAAPTVAPAAEPPPVENAPTEKAAAAAAAAAEKPKPSAAEEAASKIAASESPEAKNAAAAEEAVKKIAEAQKDLPSSSDLPSGGVAPAAVEVSAPGSGGGAAADALLHDKNLVLDAATQDALRNGAVDPRVMTVLGQLSEKHKIELSVPADAQGRSVEITGVDGEPVDPTSPSARELATEIASLQGDVRPTDVGTPFSIGEKGFFTDSGHQGRIELTFDGPPPAGFEAPAPPVPEPGGAGDASLPAAGAAPEGASPAVAAAASAPAAAAAPPVAPAPPATPAPAAAAAVSPDQATAAAGGHKPGDSGSFLAVKAESSSAGKSSSGQFRAVVQEPQRPQAAAAAVQQQPAPTAGVPADLSGVSDVYPGDNAPQPQIAAWMAKMAEERGLPRELPLMASLVESGMKNLNFGDADSVGFFQMRVGIWNQGDYAGFPEKPELQVKWFLDQAENVKKQRIAAGQPIDDPQQYGNWIADVERPAEQYRFRYQLKLDQAESLLKQAGANPAPVQAGAPAPPAAIETPGGGNGAAAVQPAPAAAVDQTGGGRSGGGVDPSTLGAEGTGGGLTPEANALLHNKNITFDDVGVKDLKAGRIDPRVVAVLTKLSHEHKITISCMCSDHPKFTSGGSVSNHHFGRGADIASVDGVPVNSSNFDAREIAMELQDLKSDYRPDEIGSPWAISGPGYFTDAAHQNHLHIGFKQELSDGWKPPADVAAPGDAAAATPAAPVAPAAVTPGAPAVASAVPAQPGAPVAAAPVPEPRKIGDSASFKVVTPEDAAAKAKGASGAFRAVPTPAGPPSAVAPAEAVPAVADAATAGASGGSGLGASALEVAKGELAKGVHETGYNTGAEVDKYLAAAHVAPGNPWCASFVTWSLEQAGHKMPGSGWAAVQTWVQHAEAKQDNLQIVSPEDARPGDLVAYDWGGQEDFGSDGHIGFLASNVKDGKFQALEGNNQDAVMSVPRQMGQANIKFIRVNGDAAAGAPAPTAGAPPVAPPVGAVQPAPPAAVEAAGQPAATPPAPPAAPAAAAVQHVTPGTAHGVRGDPAGIAAVDAILKSNGGDGAGAKALAAVTEAKRFMGTPYQWGGSTPQTGFDCSGLMQWAYAQAGVKLPRVTYDQVDIGEPVAESDLKPGDLIFFGDKDSPHHVAMSLGGDKFIHAPSTGDVVKVSSLNEPYFKSEFSGARRIDMSGPAAAAASVPAAAPAAPAIDPAEVAKAHAAVARDAAEVRRGDSAVFMAVKAMEAKKQHHATVMFMKAIDPSQVKAVAAAAPAPGAAPAAVAPGSPSDADMVQAVGAPVPANELALADVGAIGDYPGDRASQAELAKWLGDEAQKAGLPRELPVMASLVESDVKNVKGGDADSAGFFQMRVGIWDKVPEYAGYRQNPNLQAKWFIDQALAIKRQRIAAGDTNFGKDPSAWGNWIADVERPAAPYRGRYQLRLDEARSLLRR